MATKSKVGFTALVTPKQREPLINPTLLGHLELRSSKDNLASGTSSLAVGGEACVSTRVRLVHLSMSFP